MKSTFLLLPQRSLFRNQIKLKQACCLDFENKGDMSLGQCAASEDSMDLASPYSNIALVGSGVRLRLDQLRVR
jgi:hypothetical protein